MLQVSTASCITGRSVSSHCQDAKPGQNMTGNRSYSMAQGSQWVWEVIESYCCGQEGDVSGEQLSSADEHQQQTKGQAV